MLADSRSRKPVVATSVALGFSVAGAPVHVLMSLYLIDTLTPVVAVTSILVWLAMLVSIGILLLREIEVPAWTLIALAASYWGTGFRTLWSTVRGYVESGDEGFGVLTFVFDASLVCASLGALVAVWAAASIWWIRRGRRVAQHD